MHSAKQDQRLRLVAPQSGTAAYYRHIQAYAARIRGTRDLPEIIGILNEALQETRNLSDHDELAATRQQVIDAEHKIHQLKSELESVSDLLRADPLTGLLNRRGLEEEFRRGAARAARSRSPMCLTLLDLDNFKQLNDRHGHDAGDQALLHLAQVIRTVMRPTDVTARYGGEEFALILPDTDLRSGRLAIERLRSQFEVQPLVYHRRRIPISFSAGMVLYQSGQTLKELIVRADRRLYRAKQTGKNRIVSSC